MMSTVECVQFEGDVKTTKMSCGCVVESKENCDGTFDNRIVLCAEHWAPIAEPIQERAEPSCPKQKWD